MEKIITRTKNLIFKFNLRIQPKTYKAQPFTLDYEEGVYRQDKLVGLIRDTVPFFALTQDEFDEMRNSNEISQINSKAWTRISKARKDKKGDYGELLLFLVLSIFYDSKKFVTKVRLRSSMKDQIKGFDCAHFTVEGENVILWLGEAKFHKSFSGAVTNALESIEDHCQTNYLSEEISILKTNIEINRNYDSTNYKKIDNVLNGGKSIDTVQIRIPILITYDAALLKKLDSTTSKKFIEKFKKHFLKKIDLIKEKISESNLKPKRKLDLSFIIIPFSSIDEIKKNLDIVEQAQRF